MVSRTVWIPDDIDGRVEDNTSATDSYSGVVQDALELWLAEQEATADA